MIRNLVTHTGTQRIDSSVLKFGLKLSFDAQQNMPFDTPMIGEVVRRVLNHADSNWAELACLPIGLARLAGVLGLGNLRPVRDAKGDIVDIQNVALFRVMWSFLSSSAEVPARTSIGCFMIQGPLQGVGCPKVGDEPALS